MLVSKPTHGGGAPLGIDLDAGIATIKIRRPAPAATAEDLPAEPEQGVSETEQAASVQGADEAADPVEGGPDQP